VSTLPQKSVTVAENGETTAKFGDCRTLLRQCGQALSDPGRPTCQLLSLLTYIFICSYFTMSFCRRL